MYKLIDENGQDHFYHSVIRITSVIDLKQGSQYVFVQEKNHIAIWQVVHNEEFENWPMQEVTKDLTDYYKRSLDRPFDTMYKRLIYL